MFTSIRKYAILILGSAIVLGSAVFGQVVSITEPKEGTVSAFRNQFVSGQAPVGMKLLLLVNGTAVDSGYVRPDGVFEFLGVPTPAGPATYTVIGSVSDIERGRVERSIHIIGEPDTIIVNGLDEQIPADGRSKMDLSISIRDKWGTRIPESYLVTVFVDTLEMLTPDADPNSYGTQIRIVNGAAKLTLRASRQAGQYMLKAVAGGKSTTIPMFLSTPVEPLMLVGSANASLSSLSTTGNISELRDADQLSSGFHSNGRLAFYGRGSVWNNYLLTASYDNERRQKDRLFQDLDPDLLYTVYGDNSTVDYTAQTSSPFFAKIEKNRTYGLFGDFNTALNQNELARYDRTFTGLKGHYETKEDKVDAFVTVTDRKVVQQELRGEGISGFYFLKNSNVVQGSEKVRIETRDKLHNEVVLIRNEKARFSDYEIDYLQGSLFFKEPVPSMDNAGNPMYIVISYESQSGLPTSYVTGVQGEKQLMKGLTVGATAVTEERDPTNYMLFGLNSKYSMDRNLNAIAEFAHGSDQNSGGSAWRLEVSSSPINHLDLKSHFRRVENGFVNQTVGSGGTSEIGSQKYGIGGTYSGIEQMKIGLDWYRANQQTGNSSVTINSITGSAERSFGKIATGTLKIDHSQYENAMAPDTTGTSNIDAKRSTAVSARGTWHATEQIDITGEYERSFSPSEAEAVKPSVGTLGVDYRITKDITLTAQQKYYSNAGSASVFGLSSNLGYGTSVTGKYELGSGISGRRNQASIGLKNTLKLTEEVTTNLAYERSRALDRNVLEAKTADHDAFSAGVEYLPKVIPYRASARLELAKDGYGTKRSIYGAHDFKIARDFTFIEKLNIFDETRTRTASANSVDQFASAPLTDSIANGSPATGQLNKHHNAIGIAYRPVDIDWLNVLAKLDYRKETNKMVAPWTEYTSIVISLHSFVEPVRRLEIGMKYALKMATEQAMGLSASTYTDFYLVRAEYDLNWHNFDVAGEYRILSQREANNFKNGYSAEVGYVAFENIHIGVGYNFIGTKDRDLVDYTYWSQGPFVSFRMKFTEKILNYFQ